MDFQLFQKKIRHKLPLPQKNANVKQTIFLTLWTAMILNLLLSKSQPQRKKSQFLMFQTFCLPPETWICPILICLNLKIKKNRSLSQSLKKSELKTWTWSLFLHPARNLKRKTSRKFPMMKKNPRKAKNL